MSIVKQMTPLELKARLDQGDDLAILDVREPHEWEIVNLGHIGAFLIPQGDVLARVGELDKEREIVVQCRSGVRSADVIRWLQPLGFGKLWNLDGGVLRWSDEVDPRMPKY